MDLTPTWRRTILRIRDDHGHMHLIDQSILDMVIDTGEHFSHTYADDPAVRQALEILAIIQHHEELLQRSRLDYIDPFKHFPSRASDMTDEERNKTDQAMASFIITCGSQIEILRVSFSDSSTTDRPIQSASSKAAHCNALMGYLAERLQGLGSALQHMQSQRRTNESLPYVRSTWSLGGTKSSTGPARTVCPGPLSFPLRELAQAPSVAPQSYVHQPRSSRSKKEVAEEEDFSRRLAANAAMEQDGSQRQIRLAVMQKEKDILRAQLQTELQDVQVVEGKMVELSQLLGLFTGKLMAQQDQVEEIREAATGSHENVGQATLELVTTLKRNSQASQSLLLFVCLLCIGLLFLDQLVP